MKQPILALSTCGFLAVEAAAQRAYATGSSCLTLDGV